MSIQSKNVKDIKWFLYVFNLYLKVHLDILLKFVFMELC